MNENLEVKISVRNLVEFVLRSGDLDSKFMGTSRALEGTRIHQKLQKMNKDKFSAIEKEYLAEVSLQHEFDLKGVHYNIEGRADGIIVDKKVEIGEVSEAIVDEIKSVGCPIESVNESFSEVHWAQARCYGYIYSLQNNLESIVVQLTYYQIDTEEVKIFNRNYKFIELEEFFFEVINRYSLWANMSSCWRNTRDEAIRTLEFPFKVYRRGQRELAVGVYKTITEGKKLFAQAPTGIGKTISTIFPAVKAMAEGHASKLFYLTAKTITRQAAEEAFEKMRNKGLRVKTATLTAKDKICFSKGSACTPEACKYARGHFDRVNDAIFEILQKEDKLSRECIERYAESYSICPFEFSLDLALWADAVICDYNYAFDPRVYLKRFFMDNSGDYIFLIDEAHNLVDRAREMFSAELSKTAFLELKKVMKDKQPKISKALGKLNSFMLEMKKRCSEEKQFVEKEQPQSLSSLLKSFIKISEEWLTQNEAVEGQEELLDLYFTALNFIKISELYDQCYVTYGEMRDRDVKLKLFCLDPSYLLSEATKRAKAAIFFSATLTPISYYKEILGGSNDDYTVRLASPFDRDNLSLLVAETISTKYKNRDRSYMDIVEYIKVISNKRRGNYLVFFPSYTYMNIVYTVFLEKYPGEKTIIQSGDMDEMQREEFLNNFQADCNETLIGFAVIGGIFSEGIDLQGERLIGSIIVGVGLPQICFERDIIKKYFQEKNKLGYEYSYMYPGMNKVMQAAGRVIRSESDKGVVVLLDERFASSVYQNIFPKEWFPHIRIRSLKEAASTIEEFWNM
jgi:DNA excision repair protein ERCC-2